MTESVEGKDTTVAATSESLVGRRVRIAGNLATIRWGPGPVKAPPSKKSSVKSEGDGPAADAAAEPATPATVEVVGVEYDEPGHGKHDGMHQGERIFTCPPGHGSFVKVEKLELGVSIQWAIADKYFSGLLQEAAPKQVRSEAVDALEYVDSKGREKAMNVELVGRYNIEKQQQRLEGFVEASLAESRLEMRYPEDVWDHDWSLPNLKSLWLDKTLLCDWADVVAICELCPQLEWLSLAKTRLAAVPAGGKLQAPRYTPEKPPDTRLVLTPFHSRLRTLVLTETMVTWSDLLAIDQGGHFPCLEHLHLARNRISIGVPDFAGVAEKRPFPRLMSLVLDHNGISDWRVLRRAIDAFPSLQALHLNGNLLGESLEGLAEMAADETPRRLTSLFLAENRLSSWAAIGHLSSYALLELKAQRNPITEGASPVCSTQVLRQVLIGLMPTLLRLNSSEVSAKERTAAERYLLALSKQESPVVKSLAEACDVPAHVNRLQAIHGEIVGGDCTEEAQASRAALVNALVEVTLRPIGAAIMEQPQVKKRVPHTMTVAELKRLCQLLFKQVPLDRIGLLLADPALPFGLPFDDESRELGFYGVSDGAEIRVDDLADSKFQKGEKRVENLAAQMASDDV
mmetsp:Transcript_70973/g.129926  ORF Transcript_70973/g.129926 Transcript_70973/m.129926 type:complete len:628 (-) Transcript_70973:103-1986(-)